MREFAERRGLKAERRDLGELTPALLTGSAGRESDALVGELADGLDGTLAHHEFARGRTRRSSTVVLATVPGAIAFVPALVCRDAGAMGDVDLAQLPAERWHRAELESAGFNRRYRLYTLVGQDEVFLRELFSPSLIAWLERDAPEEMSFELNEGHLCVTVPGHIEDPDELDRLCETSAELARRISKEAAEEGEEHPDLFTEAEELRDLDAAIPAVRWERPPDSVGAATEAYRKVAGRRPTALLRAFGWALLVAGIVGVALSAVATPLLGVPAALLTFVPVFIVARWVRSFQHRFGSVGVRRVALEAWVREYARSRGFQLENRWAFHAAHRGLPMPGVADHSLVGEYEGLGAVRFVMFGNAPELRSRGEEISYTADRPLAASGLLVDLGRDVDAARLPEPPEEYRFETDGSRLLVWRPVQGNLVRTSPGSDRFLERAKGAAAAAREAMSSS